MGSDFSQLEDRLEHDFSNKDLLTKALTHSSLQEKNYERLEFLGDRVLGLIIAQLLYNEFKQEREGDLAKRHTALVNGETLSQIATEIDLGKHLRLSNAERASGGEENINILADVMEALIAALYIDAGLDKTIQILEKLWGERIQTMTAPPQDPKTSLQEWAQGNGLPLPSYEVTDRQGPAHAPSFTVEVSLPDLPKASATASSKKIAQKEAAQKLLDTIVESETT